MSNKTATSGLKYDVIIVFLDPNFLYDAGIPAIRENFKLKLAYLCLHGFSGPFGPKWRGFLEGVREGVMQC